MQKQLVFHHNLLGHEINESYEYFADDPFDRTIYCRKLHIVTEPKAKDCNNCPYLSGMEQGHGIECAWDDICSKDHVVRHEDRYTEYERVDKLIKQGILLHPSKIKELHKKHTG